ncbi:MAG: hypothetical protein KKA73_22740 [Chloroflexi bacterium]|nr:hypothetical protein [Chloroflexota bacterium]MBU1750510.1 hypothetical protein [Chloroflexota bacterium]
MNRRIILILLAALGLLGLAGGAALAQGSAAIEWWVLAGGGGRVSSGAVVLYDTLGQPVVGSASGGNITLGDGYWYGTGPATAVTLHSFTATAQEGVIVLTWETALEVDVLGFYVYRADAPDTEPMRLTPALIPATGGPAYTYVDETAAPGVAYAYWLELVSTDGGTARYGPAPATLPPAAPHTIYLPLVSR